MKKEIKLKDKERLEKLKTHIKGLKEKDRLKEEYKLNRNKHLVVVSGKINQEDYLKVLRICNKNKITISRYIRNLVEKELKK